MLYKLLSQNLGFVCEKGNIPKKVDIERNRWFCVTRSTDLSNKQILSLYIILYYIVLYYIISYYIISYYIILYYIVICYIIS